MHARAVRVLSLARELASRPDVTSDKPAAPGRRQDCDPRSAADRLTPSSRGVVILHRVYFVRTVVIRSAPYLRNPTRYFAQLANGG